MRLAAAMLGFTLGFALSVPVAGPVALLVFSRGLENRSRSALFLAAGAAIAEAAYAYLAFWGFASLLDRHAWIDASAGLLGALVLTALGARMLRRGGRGVRRAVAPASRRHHPLSFLLGLAITALNPVLIATWTAAISIVHGLDIVRFESADALPFALGAGAGITAWFATLLGALRRARTRISGEALARLMRGAGALLLLVGVGLVGRFARRLLWP
jgi:threonine/homoserine/homoserine lactone efflux protein